MFKSLFLKFEVNFFFRLFVWSFGGVILFYSAWFGIDFYRYYRLQAQASAHIEKLKVVEFSSDSYGIEAFYSFSVEGVRREGVTLFSKPYYLNRFSAERVAQEKSLQKTEVWYSPQNPDNSSLERIFPLKKGLNSLILLSLWAYFFLLYHQRREQ